MRERASSHGVHNMCICRCKNNIRKWHLGIYIYEVDGLNIVRILLIEIHWRQHIHQLTYIRRTQQESNFIGINKRQFNCDNRIFSLFRLPLFPSDFRTYLAKANKLATNHSNILMNSIDKFEFNAHNMHGADRTPSA